MEHYKLQLYVSQLWHVGSYHRVKLPYR